MTVPQARWRIIGVSVLASLMVTFPPVTAQEPEVPVLDVAPVQEDTPLADDSDQQVDDMTEQTTTDDTESVMGDEVPLEELNSTELSERRIEIDAQRIAESRERSEEIVQEEYQRMESLIDSAPINPFPSFYEVSRVDYPSISPPINPLPRRLDAQ